MRSCQAKCPTDNKKQCSKPCAHIVVDSEHEASDGTTWGASVRRISAPQHERPSKRGNISR